VCVCAQERESVCVGCYIREGVNSAKMLEDICVCVCVCVTHTHTHIHMSTVDVSRYVSLFVGVYVRGGERDCVCMCVNA